MAAAWHTLLAHLRKRGELYWAPAVYVLAVAYLYRDIVAGTHGFGWDTIETYWPDLVFFSSELGRGEWPLWNPFDRGGFPVSADPQPGHYYPLHWLWAGFGWLSGGVSWWLIQLKMLSHHVIAGLCMHLFLRHRGLPRAAAVVGGIAWIASSPWLIHKASNLLMPMAWTPLVWVTTDRLVQAPSWRRSAALAFAMYLAGSAGSPPGLFYTLLLAGLYGGYRVIETVSGRIRRQRPERQTWRRYTGVLTAWLAVTAVLVVCLLWITVAPGLELSEHTPRANRNLAYALQQPLPVIETLRALWVPTAGKVDAYCGIVVMILAVCAVVVRPTRDRGAPVFFLLAAAFFLLLSFGKATPVLGWLVENVPGFGLFRISNRYKCLFAPMLAVLAGYGAANLLSAGRRWSADTWKIIGVAVASVGLVVVLLSLYPLEDKRKKRYPGPKTPVTLALLGAGLVVGSALHGRRAAGILIAVMPVVMVSDPERYWHHRSQVLEARPTHERDALVGELDGVLDHRFRIYDEYALEQRAGSRLRVRDFRGYPSGDPLDLSRYRDVLRRAREHPALLEAYNVRWVLHGRHHRNGKRANHLKRDPVQSARAHFVRRSGRVREARHPVPVVAWYAGAVVVETARVLDEVLAAEEQGGVRRYAVLEPRDAQRLSPPQTQALTSVGKTGPPAVSGTLRALSADRVVVDIDAPASGLVVIAEVNYPGWSAWIDGERAQVVRANYLLRAVAVDAGAHEIEFRFEPPGYTGQLVLYWLALLWLCAAMVPWRRRISDASANPHE